LSEPFYSHCGQWDETISDVLGDYPKASNVGKHLINHEYLIDFFFIGDLRNKINFSMTLHIRYKKMGLEFLSL